MTGNTYDMTNPFRNVKLYWRRLLSKKQVTLDGVTVSTELGTLPRFIRSALFKETYEYHERQLVSATLTKSDRVLEIGTGIGFISLLCAKRCGAENVLSYEANPLLEPIIRNNYRLNGLTPNLRMRAITTDGQPITFFRSDNIVSSSTKERGGHAEKTTVQSDRFDQIIAEHKPNVIVMDVEGAEIELLSDLHQTGIKHIIVEIHPHITGEKSIEEMLSKLKKSGFEVKSHAHKTILLTAE